VLITFAPAKREKIVAERALDFRRAAEVFAGIHLTRADERRIYGEQRFIRPGGLNKESWSSSGRLAVGRDGWYQWGKRMHVKSKGSRRTWRDPDDAPEITDEWVASADLRDGKKLVRRGRPVGSAKKTQTTVRISNEVLAFFRASGRGWQTRMDEALKKYVAARQR
jgi:uncharacterized protein (DUF4415 family)